MSEGIKMFGPLAEDYAKFRPGYPAEMLDTLVSMCGLAHDWVIADIGSGTGNLARLFLRNDYQVTTVEPCPEMRSAGERLLAEYTGFRSLEGTAECIPLDAQSVDLITVGQALHWFDVDRARAEFQRILRPSGWVAVAWNDRHPDSNDFTREYSTITHNSKYYLQSRISSAPTLSDGLDRLFAGIEFRSADFPHTKRFDLEGLLGRARSSGFIPQSGMPDHEELTSQLTDLFTRYNHDGFVEFHYVARLHYGRLVEEPIDHTNAASHIKEE